MSPRNMRGCGRCTARWRKPVKGTIKIVEEDDSKGRKDDPVGAGAVYSEANHVRKDHEPPSYCNGKVRPLRRCILRDGRKSQERLVPQRPLEQDGEGEDWRRFAVGGVRSVRQRGFGESALRE